MRACQFVNSDEHESKMVMEISSYCGIRLNGQGRGQANFSFLIMIVHTLGRALERVSVPNFWPERGLRRGAISDRALELALERVAVSSEALDHDSSVELGH
ncbi:hypothetical protein RIF29_41138 [Crotalaria pallida]|uniref:Uncharacterized protein n=1 Tax=Crotalaria pallida TaxID=3830 RepID=A0AAN9E550_CROPI